MNELASTGSRSSEVDFKISVIIRAFIKIIATLFNLKIITRIDEQSIYFCRKKSNVYIEICSNLADNLQPEFASCVYEINTSFQL